MVQIPGGVGRQQIANVPWMCFWQGYPPNAQQNSPGHLNRSKTQTNRRNTLRDFPLHRFRKHLHWFRCSGKGKHLNLEARQNPAAKPLTTNVLQDFQQAHPWFRSMAGLPLVGRGLFLAFRLQTLLTEEQKTACRKCDKLQSCAVRGGFEPPVRKPVRQFSKLLV